jgi:hypothetical protein
MTGRRWMPSPSLRQSPPTALTVAEPARAMAAAITPAPRKVSDDAWPGIDDSDSIPELDEMDEPWPPTEPAPAPASSSLRGAAASIGALRGIAA